MNQTIVAALIGAAATIIGAYIVTKNTGKGPGPIVATKEKQIGPQPIGDPAPDPVLPPIVPPSDPFITRNGPFLNAIDAAGGAVPVSEFHALGRKFGFSPQGL